MSPAGFEPTAPRLGIWCSIRLSYGDTPFPLTECAPRVSTPSGRDLQGATCLARTTLGGDDT